MSSSMTGLIMTSIRASLTHEPKQMRWLKSATGHRSTKRCSAFTAVESIEQFLREGREGAVFLGLM